MEPIELATSLKNIRTSRMALEKKAEEMKKLEAECRRLLLMWLASQGTQSAKFADVGVITRTTKEHVEIRDFEKVAKMVQDQMLTNMKNGVPAGEALGFFQRRLNVGNIKALLEAGVTAESIGVEVVETEDVKLTAK